MDIGRRLAVPITLALLLVSIIPIGAGIASAASLRLASNCDLNLRTRPTTSATLRERIPSGSVVTASRKVDGGWYSTRCDTAVSGHAWYAITAIGGRTVKSLYGVGTLYAASRLFKAGPSGPIEGIDVSQWQGRGGLGRGPAPGPRGRDLPGAPGS